MKRGGFKHTVVLGMTASALLLVGGCRDEQRDRELQRNIQEQHQRQVPGTGGAGQTGAEQRPMDINPLPEEEGFKTVPEQQTAPSGIGQEPDSSGTNQRSDQHQ